MALFACSAWNTPAHAQSEIIRATSETGNAAELTVEQYEAQLEQCDSAAHDAAKIRELEQALPGQWAVRTASGTVMVSTDALREDMRKIIAHPGESTGAAEDLRARARAMRAAAEESAKGAESVDTKEAQQKLTEILQRKEYEGAEGPSAMETYMARLKKWLMERIVNLLRRLHLPAQTGNWLAWMVIWTAFLCVCYVTARWLMGKVKKQKAETPGPDAESETRHWIEEAMAAAERGDFREAIHCAYWATVAKLEEIGALNKDRARTPREALSLLEAHPEEQRLFRPMTGRFEVVWYGNRPATAEEWAGARAEMEKIACRRDLTEQTASS